MGKRTEDAPEMKGQGIDMLSNNEQVRAGLVLKARDARLFLPPGACTKCEVVAESYDDLSS